MTLPGTLFLLLKIQSLLLKSCASLCRQRGEVRRDEVTQQNTGTGSELVGPLAELLGASTVYDLLQPHKEGNPATGHQCFFKQQKFFLIYFYAYGCFPKHLYGKLMPFHNSGNSLLFHKTGRLKTELVCSQREG